MNTALSAFEICRLQEENSRLLAANKDLQGWFDDSRAELDTLNAQVAQLRHFVGVLNKWMPNIHPFDQITIDEVLAESTGDWLAKRDQEIRDAALAQANCGQVTAALVEVNRRVTAGEAA